MLKPKTALLKFSECIKIVKYAVNIVQNSAGMCIIMVSSVCGKVNAGVSEQTFVYLLKTTFYLYEYVTI